MKCKHCDGTGRRMEESDNGIGWISIECEYCNGTGEVTQTNEEWFCNLPTEEKAEWLIEFSIRFIPCELTVLSEKIKTYKNNILEWLKQPHREESKK